MSMETEVDLGLHTTVGTIRSGPEQRASPDSENISCGDTGQWLTVDEVRSLESSQKREDAIDIGLSDISRHSSHESAPSKASSLSLKLREARIRHEMTALKLRQLERKQQLDAERKEVERKLELMSMLDEKERAEAEVAFWQRETTLEQSDSLNNIDTDKDVGPDFRARSRYNPDWRRNTTAEENQNQTGTTNGYRSPTQVQGSNPWAPDWNPQRAFRSNGYDGRPWYNKPVSQSRPDVEPRPVRAGLGRLDDNTSGNRQTSGNQMTGLGSDVNGAFRSMFESINMPKPELVTFDGSPENFWSFMNFFKANIEGKCQDDRTRLTYLIQFCTGKSRESIENCILMQPDEGYAMAKMIIANQFGQSHMVSKALLDKVVNREPLRPNDGVGLWDLARQMRKCQITLDQLGRAASMNSSDTLVKVQSLLPLHLQSEWAKKAHILMQMNIEPQFRHLTEFLENSAHIANNMFGQNIGGKGNKREKVQGPSSRNVKFNQTNSNRVTALATSSVQGGGPRENKPSPSRHFCIMCEGAHSLHSCNQFKSSSLERRISFVRENKLCNNYLSPNHFAKGCLSAPRCKAEGCNKKHDTLLHIAKGNATPAGVGNNTVGNDVGARESNGNGASNATGAESLPRGQGTNCHTSEVKVGKRVCLRAVPVRIRTNDRKVTTWALLDNGSSVSLCDKRLIEGLGLKGKTVTITRVSEEFGQEVNLTAEALQGDGSIYLPRVWSVESLPIDPGNLPSVDDTKGWSHLRDIDFPKIGDQNITLLIGCDVPEAFWVIAERRGRRKEPYAKRSPLGWTVMGPVGAKGGGQIYVNHIRGESNLSEQIAILWNTDFGDLSMSGKGESQEDKRTRLSMDESVELVNGHYSLGLPWCYPEVALPNKRSMALKRLSSLKKRLEGDPELHQKYVKTMSDYIDRGYAECVQGEGRSNTGDQREGYKGDSQNVIWYLPHHPVLHPLKPEKVSVVFDCFAEWRGHSLNSHLLQRPDFNNSLIGVLLRFREGSIAVAGDVESMFHQVRVSAQDCDALRFLWWQDGDITQEPVTTVDHRMLVHLFGATSSPSCAGYALRKTADDNRCNYDNNVIETIHKNFYVDDCLKSVEGPEEAIRLVHQLCDLLGKGGFRLTKWISNDLYVVNNIPQSERAPSVVSLDLDGLPVERTLGVQWDVETDYFTFSVTAKDKPTTRRGLLSIVSSVYDPLGFVGPYVLKAKLLLQKVCRLGCGWDERIPEEFVSKWEKWLAGLPVLSGVRVSRCFKPKNFQTPVTVQLHTFADASEAGHSAVSYLRQVNSRGEVHCAFVMGKSRICPLKAVSIPRLELTAAVLDVQLSQLIVGELGLDLADVRFWTESTSVLQYIRSDSKRFHTFVANRVSKIRELTEPSQWYHVSSALNPADEGSRGLGADDMAGSCQWLNGPAFLSEPEHVWPEQPDFMRSHCIDKGLPSLENDPEVKNSGRVFQVGEVDIVDKFISYYSSWNKLRKGVAWMLRFKKFLYCKCKSREYKGGALSIEDFKAAETAILRHVQGKEFPSLVQGDEGHYGTGNFGTSLRKLRPIWKEGLWRVGGRLANAPVGDDMKHPVIRPSRHHVTDLVIRHFHALVGHSGPGMTWTAIR